MKKLDETEYLSVDHFSLKRGEFQLRDVTFSVRLGEIFAILGRTGAGKTVLLESVCGMHRGDTGTICLRGKEVTSIPLSKRNIGVVYQDYLLFPHLTVYENIIYGLKMHKVKKNEIQKKASELMEMFGITKIRDQSVATISGGESQRTALARTLAVEPGLLLLDEPFSALDPSTKEELYTQIIKIRDLYQCTILFVTHDFHEAERLADRIGIMLDGELKSIVEANKLFHSSYQPEVETFLGIHHH